MTWRSPMIAWAGCGAALLGCMSAEYAIPSDPEPVSLIQLIARPRDFTGWPVSVRGLCVPDSGAHALYVNAADAANRVSKNAVALEPDSTLDLAGLCDGAFVTVVGTFREWSSLEVWSGLIEVDSVDTAAALPAAPLPDSAG